MRTPENHCLTCPKMKETREQMEVQADPATKALIASFPGDWNDIVRRACEGDGESYGCPHAKIPTAQGQIDLSAFLKILFP